MRSEDWSNVSSPLYGGRGGLRSELSTKEWNLLDDAVFKKKSLVNQPLKISLQRLIYQRHLSDHCRIIGVVKSNDPTLFDLVWLFIGVAFCSTVT